MNSIINFQLTSLISPTSRFLVSEPEPFASGGGPELVGVHGAEMVSAAATALPVTINQTKYIIVYSKRSFIKNHPNTSLELH